MVRVTTIIKKTNEQGLIQVPGWRKLLYCFVCLTTFSCFSQDGLLSGDNADILPFPVVKYCIDPDWMPYEAIRNNQHVGMSADYMRYIGILAEVDFQLVRTKTWEESLAFLRSGQCEVASMLNKSPTREEYLSFTRPFFTGPNVIVARENQAFIQGYENIGDRKLGVVANYRQAEYIVNYYPDIDLQLVENEPEGLEKLAQGDIDLFTGSMLSVNAYIQKSGLSDLRISGIAEPQDELSMGVAKQNDELLKKLDRAIQDIPEWLHVEVYKQWNNVRVVDEIDYRYVTGAAIFLSFFIALALWRHKVVGRFNRELVSKNQELELLQRELMDKNESLEFLSMRDPLTSMFNRHFICQRGEQEIKANIRKEYSACLIIFDIDYFKSVNDQHGHSIGDKVLQEVAIRVANTIRDMDISSRWGGEEFLVLCPQTQLHQALVLANRLRKAMSQHEFTHIGNMTCSFGVSQFKTGESFTEWFNRADQALYQAKSTGRNKVLKAED